MILVFISISIASIISVRAFSGSMPIARRESAAHACETVNHIHQGGETSLVASLAVDWVVQSVSVAQKGEMLWNGEATQRSTERDKGIEAQKHREDRHRETKREEPVRAFGGVSGYS